MANLIRGAKCGSSWTQNELRAYNIIVKNSKEEIFFKEKLEKISQNVTKEFLEFEFVPGMGTPDDNDLLGYMDLASMGKEDQESMVDDFASELLKTLEFRGNGRLIRTRHSIQFFIAGIISKAQTDVCIIRKDNRILLLLQENKTLENTKDPEAQVIAEAIAAFQENNKIREYNNKEILEIMTFPCITMTGTSPIFYLIPITKELNDNITVGTYPNIQTIVQRFIPIVPRRVSDGMKPIENRKKILQCFEAFKKFVDELEESLE